MISSVSTQSFAAVVSWFRSTSEEPKVARVYKEVTRRVKKEILGAIERKIKPLDVSKEFLNAIERGDFEKISSVKNFHFQALKALKLDLISVNDFATVCLFSTDSKRRKQSVKLFNGENVNPDARACIVSTLGHKGGFFLSKEGLDDFFAQMKKEPLLQQQFLLEERKPLEPKTIRTRLIEAYSGFNVFSQCQYQNQKHVMVASAAMRQVFLNLAFPHPIKMNFVVGPSSLADIRGNGLTGSRDAALKFPWVHFPLEADGWKAEGTDFDFHDFFHSMIVSHAPLKDQERFISIADSIKRSSIDKKIRSEWYRRFVDMELRSYYTNPDAAYFSDQLANVIRYLSITSEITENDALIVARNVDKSLLNDYEKLQLLVICLAFLEKNQKESDFVKLIEIHLTELKETRNLSEFLKEVEKCKFSDIKELKFLKDLKDNTLEVSSSSIETIKKIEANTKIIKHRTERVHLAIHMLKEILAEKPNEKPSNQTISLFMSLFLLGLSFFILQITEYNRDSKV